MFNAHKKVSIGELCEFINGNGFRPPDWKSSGLPIIRIQNLNGSQNFNYFDGVPKDKWIVEPEDLLFAWAGVKGVSFGPTIWPGPRGVLNQHIFRVVPKSSIDRYWLYLALQVVTQRIEENAHGFKASLVHVRKDDITDQIVDLPHIEEQREIARVLRTWRGAIDKSETLVEMLSARRDALHRRLIHEAGSGARKTTFGSFLAENRSPGANGVSARKITVRLYGKGAVAKDEKRDGSASTRYYRRRAGQLVYSKLDFLNGAFAIVPPELDGFESTLDLPAFDILEQVNPNWLIEYLTRPNYYENQVHLARGQRKARRVAPEDFLASPINLPSREMQDRVAKILAVADQEIASNLKLLEALTRQERGLMQKLVSGDWRVKVHSEEESAA